MGLAQIMMFYFGLILFVIAIWGYWKTVTAKAMPDAGPPTSMDMMLLAILLFGCPALGTLLMVQSFKL